MLICSRNIIFPIKWDKNKKEEKATTDWENQGKKEKDNTGKQTTEIYVNLMLMM